MPPPTIEELEDELRTSRTQAWDVETFLAKRHQAKIDELSAPRSKWARGWTAAKDLAVTLVGIAGIYLIASSVLVWALFGEWPIRIGLP